MKFKIFFLVFACGVTSTAWAKFVENTDITSYVNQLIKQQKVGNTKEKSCSGYLNNPSFIIN